MSCLFGFADLGFDVENNHDEIQWNLLFCKLRKVGLRTCKINTLSGLKEF